MLSCMMNVILKIMETLFLIYLLRLLNKYDYDLSIIDYEENTFE